jgi:hypothetical protein
MAAHMDMLMGMVMLRLKTKSFLRKSSRIASRRMNQLFLKPQCKKEMHTKNRMLFQE